MATPHLIPLAAMAALCATMWSALPPQATAAATATATPATPAAAGPARPDAGDALRGARVYRQFCQHCHGPNLVNPGTVSYDLRRLQADEYPRFATSVNHGKGNMPPWKAVLKDGDVDALWAYIMNSNRTANN